MEKIKLLSHFLLLFVALSLVLSFGVFCIWPKFAFVSLGISLIASVLVVLSFLFLMGNKS